MSGFLGGGFGDALAGDSASFLSTAFGGDVGASNYQSGREEATKYSKLAREDLTPYRELGQRQIGGLESLMNDPYGITQTPFYKFQLSEGLGALERSKLAKGKFFSGETSRDILDYAEGLASTSYQDEFMRRFNLVNLGQSAATGSANIFADLGKTLNQSQTNQGNVKSTAALEGGKAVMNLFDFG